jgi:hypothetical protein
MSSGRHTAILNLGSVDTLITYNDLVLSPFNTSLPLDKRVTPQQLMAVSQPQHMLSTVSYAVKVDQFITNCINPLRRASVQAAMGQSSGACSCHTPTFGDRMSSVEWQCAARFRLGLPLYSRALPCPCCQEQLDIYGIHAAHCAGEGGTMLRHNMIRDVLVSIAQDARVSHRVEAGYLLTDDRSGQKPADLLLLNWEAGRSVCIDISVANSFQFLFENRPFVPMEALTAKERSKHLKYDASCAARDLVLRPFVCSSLGLLSDASVVLIKQLGTALSATSGIPRELTIAVLRRRITFTIQKAQASSWLRRGTLADVLA